MKKIQEKSLISCEKPLDEKSCEDLLQELGASWKIENKKNLTKTYLFPNFLKGLEFIQHLTPYAEEIQHHPDLTLSWGKVVVSLTTHSLGGISKKDFILAEHLDALYTALSGKF